MTGKGKTRHAEASHTLSKSFRFSMFISIILGLNSTCLSVKKQLLPRLFLFLPSHKVLLILIPLLLLPYSSITSALSASTANSIEGTAPYLLLPDGVTKLINLNELLGFTMPNQDGSVGREQIDASMAGSALTAPIGMAYNDVMMLVVANGVTQTLTDATVGDDDGEAANVANATVTGTMKATWYNGGIAVPAADLGNSLTSCGGPYTLTLEAPTVVSASTTYGAPNTNAYGSHTGVTYTFNSNSQSICYLKPKDLTTYTGTVGSSVKFTNGYNSATFDVVGGIKKGFTVASGFPTTGFEAAAFSVIGSGNDQSKYRCNSTDNGGKISLSGLASTALGANCMVTYNSTSREAFIAGGTPTINMEYNTTGSTWIMVDSYTIPTPNRWAIFKSVKMYGTSSSLTATTQKFPALDVCRGVADGTTTWSMAAGQSTSDKTNRQQFMYRRDELTNSPQANTAENSSPTYVANSYSRDVDGTFMGEWGEIQNYPSPGWASNIYYWTAEAWSTAKQFVVRTNGSVSYTAPNASNIMAVCRG